MSPDPTAAPQLHACLPLWCVSSQSYMRIYLCGVLAARARLCKELDFVPQAHLRGGELAVHTDFGLREIQQWPGGKQKTERRRAIAHAVALNNPICNSKTSHDLLLKTQTQGAAKEEPITPSNEIQTLGTSVIPQMEGEGRGGGGQAGEANAKWEVKGSELAHSDCFEAQLLQFQHRKKKKIDRPLCFTIKTRAHSVKEFKNIFNVIYRAPGRTVALNHRLWDHR